MKQLLPLLLFWLGSVSLVAQEKHFLFLQADNEQPFYVQLNNKLFSSSATGYVIIPKLQPGKYDFIVGFPQNVFPEQKFSCNIENKDVGFNLKNFGEKGWGLFNLQTFEVVMAEAVGTSIIAKNLQNAKPVEDQSDPIISFDRKPKDTETVKPVETVVASPVVDLVKEPLTTQEVVKVEIKDLTTKTGVAKETVTELPAAALIPDYTSTEPISLPGTFQVAIENVTSIKLAEAPLRTGQPEADTVYEVKKVTEEKSSTGVKLAYVDAKGRTRDTIQVDIPVSPTDPPPVPKKELMPVVAIQEENATITTPITNKEEKPVAESVTPQLVLVTNNACKAMGSEEDFFKLRKKMLSQMSDEKMIMEAKKVFEIKCFTTQQVKALSVLFMSDEGRYRFTDAAYNYVSDPGNYPLLQSEFVDPYYLKRFKAMLR